MKLYEIISSSVDTRSSASNRESLASFEFLEDAKDFLAQIYERNRFNSDIKDIYFDGTKLSLTNVSTGTYSNYCIKKMQD
jgi:hypothetical protein